MGLRTGRFRLVRHLVPAAVATGLVGCGEGNMSPSEESSSFGLLQTEIFDAYCVDCHVSGSAIAEQSGLALESGVSYDEIVGVDPVDEDALADGLKLVDPGHPDGSLLLHRVRADLPPTAPSYGGLMPLGGSPLTTGEVEFMRRWIEAGAPREGTPVDRSVLDDDTPQQVSEFRPPAPPAEGVQLHLGPFPVQPGGERELFAYRPLGNAEEIWVDRVEIAMRPGSHHFLLYQYGPDTPAGELPATQEYRDYWNPDGSFNGAASGGHRYRRSIAGAQTADEATILPEGVAIRLPTDAFLDLNSHYLNYTDDSLAGEVYVNLHTVDPRTVEHEARSLFLSNAQLYIPPHAPGETTTISRTWTLPRRIRIVNLTSHMHKKGTRFVIRRVGTDGIPGEILYETESWDHPDITYYEPALELAAGEGLRIETTYHNPTDEAVTFGLTSFDEMSIALGYYYLVD